MKLERPDVAQSVAFEVADSPAPPQGERRTTTAAPSPRRNLFLLHISDLHFGRGFDDKLWKSVCNLARQASIDHLIVTGDLVNSPWPFALLRARKELMDLASGCGAGLVVVPGNHDVGILGNIRVWPFSRFFGIVFSLGQEQMEPFTSDTEFRALSRTRKLRAWIKAHLLFAGHAIAAAWRSYRYPQLVFVQDPDHGLFVAGIDSNQKLRLATGSISDSTIYELSDQTASLRAGRDPRWAFGPRLAVLHHHALPLPYSIVRESMTSYEPFLVLRNAGTLLSELTRCGFDLVLHGHKHYHCFSRIAYDTKEESISSVAVMSAGSAAVRLSAAGRNSANLITCSPSGRISIQPIFMGGGQSPVASNSPAQPASIAVHSYAGLKKRNFRRSIELQSTWTRSFEREVVIDEYGTARLTQQVHGLRVCGGFQLECYPVRIQLSRGRVAPSEIDVQPACDAARGIAFEAARGEPTHDAVGKIYFGRTLIDDDTELSFRWNYLTHNAFLTTSWEARELGQPPEEYVGMYVRYPCERLRLTLELPESLNDPKPFIRISRPRDYPALELDDTRFVRLGDGEEEPDSEAIQFEAQRLVKTSDLRWAFEVDYPQTGYLYQIRWTVSARGEQGTDPLRSGESKDLRALLRKYRDDRMRGTADEGRVGRVSSLMQDLRSALAMRYRARYGGDDEQTALSLMVYDDSDAHLALVDTARSWDHGPRWTFKIPLGEGLAGACFKQGRPLMFISNLLQHDAEGALYLFASPTREGQGTEYQALVSVPLVHPDSRGLDRTSPADRVGVMSFASTAMGSRLREVYGAAVNREQELLDIMELAQATFEGIVEELLAGSVH